MPSTPYFFLSSLLVGDRSRQIESFAETWNYILFAFFFFISEVFKSEPNSKDDNVDKVAESILNFFPGFDAFKLPPPSSDPEVILNLDREEVQPHINKSFIRGVQEFKGMLFSKLSPKRSFQDGEYVTGEGKLNGFMKGKFMMIYVLIQSFDIWYLFFPL